MKSFGSEDWATRENNNYVRETHLTFETELQILSKVEALKEKELSNEKNHQG